MKEQRLWIVIFYDLFAYKKLFIITSDILMILSDYFMGFFILTGENISCLIQSSLDYDNYLRFFLSPVMYLPFYVSVNLFIRKSIAQINSIGFHILLNIIILHFIDYSFALHNMFYNPKKFQYCVKSICSGYYRKWYNSFISFFIHIVVHVKFQHALIKSIWKPLLYNAFLDRFI